MKKLDVVDRPESGGEQLRRIRLDKIQQLRAAGVEPYALRTPNHTPLDELRKSFEEKQGTTERKYVEEAKAHKQLRRSGEDAGDPPAKPERSVVGVAGRIRQSRAAGKKLKFVDIADQSGTIQLFLNRRELSDEDQAVLDLTDLGDWVWAEGSLGLTQTGELSVFATQFRILSKAILQPPQISEKTSGHGVTDAETRQRQRYLDLMVNNDSRRRFEIRSKIVSGIRCYLDGRNFLEVETPMMQPLFGGATARPFITHHNTLNLELYLRIAPELYLKRLLVGGMERVYEVNRNFRNEGIDTQHNPEFTMLELYEAFGDYHSMMDITEGIYGAALEAAGLSDEIDYQGDKLSFARPWPRYRWVDLFHKHVGVEWGDRPAMELKATEYGLDFKAISLPTDWLGAELWEHAVESKLVQPCFVIDYPTAISPLSKQREDDPAWVERFEVFAVGMELGNAFSELNDPIEQRRRFADQVQAAIVNNDDELPREIDEDYITALAHGMPPAGGLGLGIDRLVMLLTNTPTIRDVILFPQMRPRNVGDSSRDGATV